MKIYDFLKQNDFLRRIVKSFKIKREFNYDLKKYSKYYNDSGNEFINTYEYKILLLVHSLEKGMCHSDLRPFGEEKISDLIELLKKYIDFNSNSFSTAFKMGYNILVKWISLYDNNNWEKTVSYNLASEFVKKYNFNFLDIDVGSYLYKVNEIKYIDHYNFLKSRHSVRNFKDDTIQESDIKKAIEAALMTPTACNRQMCKIYYVKDNHKKNELKKLIMGLSGFNKNNVNLFVVTFDLTAFSFYGERNQGFLNSGLVSMNFVNELHDLNIGSCFLQWGNSFKDEEFIKALLDIPECERIAIVIGAGYYLNDSVIPCSQRKSIEEIYKEI